MPQLVGSSRSRPGTVPTPHGIDASPNRIDATKCGIDATRSRVDASNCGIDASPSRDDPSRWGNGPSSGRIDASECQERPGEPGIDPTQSHMDASSRPVRSPRLRVQSPSGWNRRSPRHYDPNAIRGQLSCPDALAAAVYLGIAARCTGILI